MNDYVAGDDGSVIPEQIIVVTPPGEPGIGPEPVRVPPGPLDPLAPATPPLTPLDAYTLAALFRPEPVPEVDFPAIFTVDSPEIAAPAEKPVAAEDECVPEPPKPVVKPRPKASLLDGRLKPAKPAASESPVPIRKRFVPPPIAKPADNC